MSSESVASFVWPMVNNTVSIVTLVLAVVIFIFGMFSGARANKVRMVFAVCLSTVIGWFTMPMAVKLVSVLNMLDTMTGIVILITVMMAFVAALAAIIYEIITVLISRLSGVKIADYLGQGLVFSICFDEPFLEVASLLLRRVF